jgi:hypothetical protein
MSKPTSRPRAAIATSLALAGALLVTLTGCAGAPASVATGLSSPGAAAPLFASDAEALAAATAAYAKYLEVSDQIARDGGANPERLKPYVSSTFYSKVLESTARFVATGSHGVGASSFSNIHIQSTNVQLNFYICNDVTSFRLQNSLGVDVTPVTRSNIWPLVLSFEPSTSGLSKLVISGSETWTGTNFC